VEGVDYLGFDGKYIMPNATPVFLAQSGVSGVQTDEAALTKIYGTIQAEQPQQELAYAKFIEGLDASIKKSWEQQAACLGISLDVSSGHISYAPEFASKRLELSFDLMYVRHGKTTGNTEPRVYQGFVDEPNNALNSIGLQQAEDAADKLGAMGLKPDLVILSPLARAKDTGEAFIRRHEELRGKTEIWNDSAEMQFGEWDNVMVKDLPTDNICHLFYLSANALVKSFVPYKAPNGSSIEGECFVEVLTRMHSVLKKINDRFSNAAGGKRPLVVMYGHSMAGAALSILTGNGKQVEGVDYLGFDGKYIMPNATPVLLTQNGSYN
jgi:broad specificity phosphatase PhoE